MFEFAAGTPIGAASAPPARVERTFLILVAIRTDCPGRLSTRVIRGHDAVEAAADSLLVGQYLILSLISFNNIAHVAATRLPTNDDAVAHV